VEFISSGFSADLFWSLTPREIQTHQAGAARRMEREEQSRRWHTWHVAWLPRQKQFASFAEFVRPAESVRPTRRVQPPDEQIAVFRQLMDRRKRGNSKGP
jgi:hypothetical protein